MPKPRTASSTDLDMTIGLVVLWAGPVLAFLAAIFSVR